MTISHSISHSLSHPPSTPIPILLLKAANPSPSLDAYTTCFQPPTYQQPLYITPLATTNLHADLLPLLQQQQHPQRLIPHTYSALIFTSQRAVSSLAAALSTLPSAARAAIAADWALPLYAVGPATAAALRGVVRERMPRCTVRGEEAGRGGELARVVAEGVEEEEEGAEEEGGREVEEREKENQLERGRGRGRKGRRRVLVLVGEKRRDELQKGLQEVGIGVDEVVVYATALADGFEEEFQRALGETEETEEEKEEEEGLVRSGVRWVVVFSPQGGREMLKGLGWMDERSGRAEGESRLETEDKRAGEEGQRRTFVASIGPTTAQYLEREFGFGVDVQAARPSPEGVKEGIERFMRERGFSLG